jgi:hypothetical protein
MVFNAFSLDAGGETSFALIITKYRGGSLAAGE